LVDLPYIFTISFLILLRILNRTNVVVSEIRNRLKNRTTKKGKIVTVPVSIMWFRQDLRVKDNPALNAACDMGKIVPIYIYDEATPDGRIPGGASQWWLHHSLASLNERLNGHLQIFKGDPKQLIPKLLKEFSAKSIFWNRCYEPWQKKS
jgi:hypothetical protein